MDETKNTSLYPYNLIGKPLSEKELCVLEAMSDGYTVDEIANFLYITKFQCRWIVKKIYCKLGVDTKLAAIIKGVKSGII